MEDNHFGQVRNKDRPDEAARNQQSGVPTIRELQQHAIPAERDRHHSRPQNVDWTASQYCEPIIVGRIKQPPVSNHSKSERKCQCSYAQKRKRTTSTYTSTLAEVSRSRLRTKCRLVVSARNNYPIAVSISNHLGKKARIPEYAKFLKELCIHKRRKIKGSREIGGVVSALTKNEEFTTGATRALPRKCRDPGIFSIPCTIGECTFADVMLDLGASINVMLDLGASINVMPALIYRSLNFW
ncbi:hypothetical protein CR513_57192, partial [Mucuna pruriens]